MSPDIEQSVKHAVAVTDCAIASMLEAKDFDRASVCCGLAVIATMLVKSDQDKTMLAQMMLRLARQLDPELVDYARWH